MPAVRGHADPDGVEHGRGKKVHALGPQDLPGEGAGARVLRPLGLLEEALEEIGREDDVGVEDEDPGAPGLHGLADREVVAARVAEVLARGDDGERDGRHLLERGERGARAVLRGIVHGHDREVPERLREEGRQQPLDVARLVVRDDRDENARSSARHEDRPPGKERRAPAEAEKPADDARVRPGRVGPRVVGPDEREEREPQERARERRGPRGRAGPG